MGGKISFPVIQIPKERIFVVTGANTGDFFFWEIRFFLTAH